MPRSFTPELFRFLRDLEANNEKPWFQENRPRYDEHVKDPALEFINAFRPHLARISTKFVADSRPVGGSLFRINRDTRFAKDKTPYKTNTGLHFRHEMAKDVHAPGFYLHLEPGACFAGVGIWHPDAAVARNIRQAIVDDPSRWKRATKSPRFTEVFSLGGDRLKRPPREFPVDHPLVEDLKWKDFIASTRLTQTRVASTGFLEEYAGLCRRGVPLMKFLCEAVGVPF